MDKLNTYEIVFKHTIFDLFFFFYVVKLWIEMNMHET
jgi:hypothetical protein